MLLAVRTNLDQPAFVAADHLRPWQSRQSTDKTLKTHPHRVLASPCRRRCPLLRPDGWLPWTDAQTGGFRLDYTPDGDAPS